MNEYHLRVVWNDGGYVGETTVIALDRFDAIDKAAEQGAIPDRFDGNVSVEKLLSGVAVVVQINRRAPINHAKGKINGHG